VAAKGDSAPTFVKYIPAVIAALTRLGGSGRPDEVRAAIATDLNLSDEAQLERLPSGVQSRFENQVHWARFYLAKAGYIEASQHGVWTLSEKARQLGSMSASQAREIYHEVREQLLEARTAGESDGEHADEVEAGVEADGVLSRYREAALTRLRDLPASGFERFAQRLLRESGFQEVSVTGRSGDGGHRRYRRAPGQPTGQLQGPVPVQEVRGVRQSESGSRLSRCDDGPG
jgi:restriction system protein